LERERFLELEGILEMIRELRQLAKITQQTLTPSGTTIWVSEDGSSVH
jgi:hypothetical protein